MATCIACEAEVDTLEAEVGDTLTCVECGAEMEVISLRPLELELVDDVDDDVDAAEPDDDEAADEDDDLAS
jgi:lysine biosynthesis protein LysW